MQAANKMKRKRKNGGERTKPADPGTSEVGCSPPAAKKWLPCEGETTRPATPVSSPIEVAQPGDESKGGHGGAGMKRKHHTSGLLEQMTARLSGSKFR